MRKKTTLMMLALLVVSFAIAMPFVAAEEEEDIEVPFTVAVANTPSKLDPHDAYDSVSIDVIAQVTEGLYGPKYDGDMSPQPIIASEMGTWNADLTELTIPLREDITFHDGTALTADDVVWSFDRLWTFANSSQSTHAVLWKTDEVLTMEHNDSLTYKQMIWSDIEAVDDYTVKFTLYKPWVVFEKLLAFSGAAVLKEDSAPLDEFLGVTDDLIGCGPFELVSVSPDEKTTFEGYDDYHRGAPSINTMVYLANPDGDAASQAFLNHETHFGGVTTDYLDQAEADPVIQIQNVKETVKFYIQFNVQNENLPREAREALAFAFNYSYLLEITNDGEDFALHQPIPDGMQYYEDVSVIEGLPEYDLEHARSLLLNSDTYGELCTDAGLSASSTDADWIDVARTDPIANFSFSRYTSSYLEEVAAQLTTDMEYIGIEVWDNHVGDWGTWTAYSVTNKDDLELSFGGWGPDYNDPINMIEPIYQTGAAYNTFQLADSTLDGLMGDTYAATGDDRKDLFVDIVDRLYGVDGLYPGFYLFQRGGRLMWNTDFVTDVEDNFNAFGQLYFYNCTYVPGQTGIAGFPIGTLLLAFLGVSAVTLSLMLRKKK